MSGTASDDAAPYPSFDGTQMCRADGVDPDDWFPDGAPGRYGGQHITGARAIAACHSCAWLEPCLRYALTHDVVGIWGGTTADERRDARATVGIRPTPVRFRMPDVPRIPARDDETDPMPEEESA